MLYVRSHNSGNPQAENEVNATCADIEGHSFPRASALAVAAPL